MRRTVCTALFVLAFTPPAFPGQSPATPLAGPPPAPLEFEVASIKRNTSDRPPIGAPLNPAATSEVVLRWSPARIMVLRAFPVSTIPVEIVGLPSWADSERYDVVAKVKPGTTLPEQQQMWRALLADRMKLVAHYETRQRQAYELVVARTDGQLGSQLRPSTLDCASYDPAKPPEPPPAAFTDNVLRQPVSLPPAAEQELMSRCGATFGIGKTTYAGAIDIAMVIRSIGFGGGMDRPIIDRTGLTGRYSMKLSFSRPSLTPPGPDDPPPLETALREQLGLKLQPTTIDGQVLVVDHIEKPTEN